MADDASRQAEEMKALKALCGFLWNRVDLLTAVTTALRGQLIATGVVSEAALDAQTSLVEKTQQVEMLKAHQQGLDAYQAEWLRKFFASVKGPIQ
jgi:hypothetical protein